MRKEKSQIKFWMRGWFARKAVEAVESVPTPTTPNEDSVDNENVMIDFRRAFDEFCPGWYNVSNDWERVCLRDAWYARAGNHRRLPRKEARAFFVIEFVRLIGAINDRLRADRARLCRQEETFHRLLRNFDNSGGFTAAVDQSVKEFSGV